MLKKIIIPVIIFTITSINIIAQTKHNQLRLKDTITDRNIQVPIDADHNLEELLIDWKKKFKHPSNYNPSKDKDIIYPDSTYVNRLYSLPTEMELVYNQIVRSYIDLYSSRRRSSVSYMLGKGKYYFPLIEETLDKYQLPLELKYLPVIESAINPAAVSRAGATGLWQFMLATGRMYDLEVNSLVDERRDPIKATDAAARYLKDLYDIYGDWNLVIAAYNCGPGNVNKAIRRSGGQRDYWAIYPNLPRETRGYVPLFIAATYIMSYHQKHNIQPMEYIYPIAVDTVMVTKNLHFQQVSDLLNIPIEELRDLNPQYKKDIIPGDHKPYSICLPSNIAGQFLTHQDTIFRHKSQDLLTHRKIVEAQGYTTSAKGGQTHKVKRGENLGAIARKYGVTVNQIQRLNNMKSTRINPGKTLIIRQGKPATQQSKTENKKPTETPAATKSDTKKEPTKQAEGSSQDSADTESSAGSFFAEYYKNIQEDDDNTDELLENEDADMEVADSISIDVADTTIAESDDIQVTNRILAEDTQTIYHKVRIGETLLLIANRYNVSTKEIQEWNNIDSKKVSIGQRLKIMLPKKELERMVEARKEAEAQKEADLKLEAEIQKEEEEKRLAEEKKIAEERKVAEEKRIAEEKKRTEERRIAEEKEHREALKQAEARRLLDKNKNGTGTPRQKTITYVVKKGDTLSGIAKRYKGVKVNDIMKASNITSDKLSLGQKLTIPIK